MEVQDHSLMVVSLDNNISTVGGNIGKPNGCIYTAAMSAGNCSHETSVVELTSPVQCLGTTIPRLQHQHLAQLQPIQYPQTISYEPTQPIHQHTNLMPSHAIYQPLSTASLHHYSSSQAILSNAAYLNTASATSQTIHLAPAPTISPSGAVIHNPPAQEIQLHPISELQPIQQAQQGIEESDDPDEPVETVPEPTFPEDDFEYYKEIFDYLIALKFPAGVTENYKKHLMKRSQHYTVIDGKLFHNRKQPKEVVMKKEDQLAMIKECHVVKETGVHLGVKKMFHKVQMKNFWRGMYIDVVTFVKNCEKCSDAADMERQKHHLDEENEEDIENPSPVEQMTVGIQCSDSSKVWKKVEVWLHGPLKLSEIAHGALGFLATVVDQESRWVTASPISSLDNAPEIADFLFHTFCSYGFPSCQLVGVSLETKDRISEELKWKMKNLVDLQLSVIDESVSNCLWVKKLVSVLTQTYPEWDKNLNHFLFQYRIGQLKSLTSPDFCTPFSALFNHNPLNSIDISDENKENIDGDFLLLPTKKKLKGNPFKCEECDEVFTSKISFRIHQRRHPELKSGAVDDECRPRTRYKRKKKSTRKGILKTTSPPSASVKPTTSEIDFKPPEACVESTVSAIKALLAATKEERRRRGKYHKYSPELQEHMATYAVKHGNQQAVKYFSERLGTVVSESTIRNIVKVHSSFTPLLKDEIGRFAANFGVESASRYFSDRLKRDVSQSLVRKFKIIHLKKLPDASRRQKDKMTNRDFKKRHCIKKVIDFNSGKNKRFTNKIKEEIGYYACHHSITDTAKHFSDKFQTIVKERTVRRFYKNYLERYNTHSSTSNQPPSLDGNHLTDPSSVQINVNLQSQPQTQSISIYTATQFPQQIPLSATTTCLQSASRPLPQTAPSLPLYPLNHCSENDYYQTTPSSVIMTQTSQNSAAPFQYQSITSIQNFQPTQPYSSQVIPAVPHQPQPDQSSFVMAQQPLIVSNEPNNLNISTHFMVSRPPDEPQNQVQPSVTENNIEKSNRDNSSSSIFTVVKCEQEKSQPVINSDNCSQTNASSSSTVNISDISCSVQQKQNLEQCDTNEKETNVEDSEDKPLLERLNGSKNKNNKSKKKEATKKRGKYTFYSPELRAEIGKYAAEHSSIKACQHFSKLLGHDVPESTARGLKEKYLQKKIHCTVTSLGYSQRGRPLRLGKYDEIVQECLKELVRHGEKVTSYLAITTAKLIVNKYEPSLLEDNGGPIKLNITWAKSFLKRIGVHNNS